VITTITNNNKGIFIIGKNKHNEIRGNTLKNNLNGLLIREGAQDNSIISNNLCFNQVNDISCESISNRNSFSRNLCTTILKEQCNNDISCNACPMGGTPARILER